MLERSVHQSADKLFASLDEIFPDERPALLHGDLWSGNIMMTNRGPSIYDPAVYFGLREVDLSMTRLFGGFDPAFYQGYHETFPLEKNWEERSDIFNLYPLLAHVVMFGGSYIRQVERILKRF
jgi:fructosamine-3-kinase